MADLPQVSRRAGCLSPCIRRDFFLAEDLAGGAVMAGAICSPSQKNLADDLAKSRSNSLVSI